MLIVRPNERRRSSLANPGQSRSRPCLAPAFAKTLLKPVCQSRMVPPVSNVRAFTSYMGRVSLLIRSLELGKYAILWAGEIYRLAGGQGYEGRDLLSEVLLDHRLGSRGHIKPIIVEYDYTAG